MFKLQTAAIAICSIAAFGLTGCYSIEKDKRLSSRLETTSAPIGPFVDIVHTPALDIAVSPRNDVILSSSCIAGLIIPVDISSNDKRRRNYATTKNEFIVHMAFQAHGHEIFLAPESLVLVIDGKSTPATVLAAPSNSFDTTLNPEIACSNLPQGAERSHNQSHDLNEVLPQGQWQCMNAVFPVDTPDPETKFSIAFPLIGIDGHVVDPQLQPLKFSRKEWHTSYNYGERGC
ncbi:hypothetical protein [Andreprevotia chitinilytica]|uniref:hypothetical protein n=1 Tax=Andreprevotia chitinilytica TaxID=396808 RepID=UPI0012EC1F2F|nr:hypothetical protein [Andreprevotia chitinilytica]